MSEPNTASNGKTQRPRKWPKVLLAVSLTLNLLVVGMVAGAHLRSGSDARFAGPAPARSAMRDLGFGAFMDAMPREQRRALGRELRDRAGSFTANRDALGQEFNDIMEALRADPYRPEQLRGVLDMQKARINQRVLAGRDLVLDRIKAMSLAERQAFANRLEHSMQRALDRSHR